MQIKSSSTSFVLRRLMAFLYDSFLLIAIFFVVTSVGIALNDGQAIENHAFKVLLVGFAYLFFSWFWRHGGQTLGMQAWRIQVVSENDKNISHLQCAQRFTVAILMFGLTLISAMFSKTGQGFHDKLSKTKIIYKSKV